MKALSKRSGQRYSDAASLAVDLQRWLNGQPVQAYRRKRRRKKKGNSLLGWCRRHLVALLATAASVALIASLGVAALWYAAHLRQQTDLSRHEAEQARRQANTVRCDLFRERGRKEGSEGLRCLAESWALAIELDDEKRRQAASDILSDNDPPLPSPPGLVGDAKTRWNLAAHLLLGRRLPDADDWQALGERMPHLGDAALTGFGGAGQKVLTADLLDKQPRAFRDARTGEAFGEPVFFLYKVNFLPGGRHAIRVSSVWDIWDLVGAEVFAPKRERDWRLSSWGASSDGTKLVIAWRPKGQGPHEPTLSQIWDLTAAQPRPLTRAIRLPLPPGGPMLVNNDGTSLATVTAGRVLAWSISDHDKLGPEERERLENAGDQRRALEQEAAQPPRAERFPTLLEEVGVSAAAFHPDGRHLLIATSKHVEMWESSGERVGELLPASGVKELVVGPQAVQVLTRDANGWQLWDMQSRRRVGLPLDRLQKLHRVAFSADGRQLLTVSDGDARLWLNPLVPAADRARALRLWAQAATGFDMDEMGELRPLDNEQRQDCASAFAHLAGLEP